MLEAFDKFTQQVLDTYAVARGQLARGEYARAQETLAGLAEHHAKTSLSLRSFLIKTGRVTEDPE